MEISGSEKGLAVLGYLPLLFIIPVKLKRDSMFVQFHGRQGGVLFMLWVILALICIIVLIFVGAIPLASTIVLSILMIGTFVYAFMALIAIIKVLMGERYRMPVVADIALKMGL